MPYQTESGSSPFSYTQNPNFAKFVNETKKEKELSETKFLRNFTQRNIKQVSHYKITNKFHTTKTTDNENSYFHKLRALGGKSIRQGSFSGSGIYIAAALRYFFFSF